MRKMILSALVTVVAGACWVLAQNTSPYGVNTNPLPKSTPPVASPSLPPVVPASLPADEVVAPATQLDSSPKSPNVDIPAVPAAPQVQSVSIEPIPTPPVAAAPPSAGFVAPPDVVPPAPPTMSAMPILEPPALIAPAAPIAAPPEPVAPASDIPPAPITPPPRPAPPLAPLPEKQPARAATTAALPSILALPPVPGVNSAPPLLPPPTISPSGFVPAGVGNNQLPAAYSAPIGPALNNPLPPPGPSPTPTPINPVSPPSRPQITVAVDPVSQPQPATYTVSDPAGVFDSALEGAPIPFSPAIWGGADYLMWFVKPMRSPSLVDSVSGAPPGQSGYQGPQVAQLFPTSGDKYNPLNGVRGIIGFWLSDVQVVGVEGSYSTFVRSSVNDLFVANPGTFLARPFVNADTGMPSYAAIPSVNGTNGAVEVAAKFQTQGGDVNLLVNALRSGYSQLNVLVGGRYFEMNESLQVNQQLTNAATGFSSQSYDEFDTRNNFFGGQLGLRWNYDSPTFFAAATGKIAFGAMEENVRINGGTTVNVDGVSSFGNGGLLALPSNIGSYSRTRTAFIPEFTGSIGYHIAPWATATVGYNFLYVTNVVRPGNQIDTTISPENLPFAAGSPTAARPQFQFHDESVWLQGFNAGLTFTY